MTIKERNRFEEQHPSVGNANKAFNINLLNKKDLLNGAPPAVVLKWKHTASI